MTKEKSTTKICKHCKSEIAARARICPQCRKKQGPGGCLMTIIVFVCLGLFVSCFSSGSDKAGTTNPASANSNTPANNNASTETTAPEKDSFSIGEFADINGIQVALVGVTESNGAEYFGPEDGNIYVVCEFEISNGSSKDIAVSSMISFEAYCDDYSVNQDIMGLQSPEVKGKNQLDGSVAAGKKMNGIIAYEVPKNWRELEIKFSPSFWSNKSAVFVATK